MMGKKGGLMKRFKEGKNRRERLLFPPSIDAYLPDSHLARVPCPHFWTGVNIEKQIFVNFGTFKFPLIVFKLCLVI